MVPLSAEKHSATAAYECHSHNPLASFLFTFLLAHLIQVNLEA